MRSSIARRPVTSPCLLCTLRATATAERSIPRTASRRRFNRRVHSSANRLAGENLASRPEPEDDGLHSLPTAQKPSFSGFGNTRTASIAASKWGRKPANPVAEPAPVPPPEPQQTQAHFTEPRLEPYDPRQGHYHFRPPNPPVEPIQDQTATESVNTQGELKPAVESQKTPQPFTLDNLAQFIEKSKVEPPGGQQAGENAETEARKAESIHTTGDQPKVDPVTQSAAFEAQVSVETEYGQEVSPVLEATPYNEARVSEGSAAEDQYVQETPDIDAQAPILETSAPLEQEPPETPVQQLQENQESPLIEGEAPLLSQTEASPVEASVAEHEAQTILPIEPEASLDATAQIDAAAEVRNIQDITLSSIQTPEVSTLESQLKEESLPPNAQARDLSTMQADVPTLSEFQTQDASPLATEANTVTSSVQFGTESVVTTEEVPETSNIISEPAPAESHIQAQDVSTSPKVVPVLSDLQNQEISSLPTDATPVLSDMQTNATPILSSQKPTQPINQKPAPSPAVVSFSAKVQSAISQTTPSPPIQQPLSFLDKPATAPAPTTFARKSVHASASGMSWAQRELSAMPAPTTPAPGKWARASAESRTPQGLSFQSSTPFTPPLTPLSSTPMMSTPGSQAAAVDYQTRQDISAEDLKALRKQHAQALSTFEKPVNSEESLTRNSEIRSTWRVAASGAVKWGVGSKKSVFAASDSNDILDQLSGKASTEQPIVSRERQTFGERDPFDEYSTQRSFQEFKTSKDRYGFGKVEFGDTNLVDEAFAEAGYVDDAVGSGRKSKKERRRKAELEAKAAQEEALEWSRRSSAKERDKAKHSRQWATEDDAIEEVETKAQMKERKRLERERKAKERAEQEQQLPPILIPEFVSINTLARLCKVKLEPFTRKMEELGFTETNPNHVLNAEIAGLISMEYGFEPILDKSHERDLVALPVPADKSVLPPRPPVVTIMGHVDHGKTTILDWLRKSSIVDQEHGGITQHIGAFSVNMPSGRIITFLDTPGHEAFLKMRERGANMTDIVILVVAADDSIMPQTIEAIKHAKAAGVPIIVAINKCDKEDADPERVKSDLAQYDIQIEAVGGDTQVVCVSGKTGLGMEDLEEAVLLQADDIDMRADTTGRMEGWVVETSTKAKGRVATVLVRRGTLRRGDVIVAGTTWARVRNMITDTGAELEEALPGTPVEIDGWRDQPDAGDEILQAVTEEKAKSVVEYRMFKQERLQLAKDIEAINESRRLHQEKKEREARLKELQEQGMDAEEAAAQVPEIKQDEKFKVLEVPFIIKADVAGSVEAVEAQVLSVANEEARTMVLKTGVGPLTESDIRMAESTGAYCLTFNVPTDPDIMALARFSNVKTIHHTVIYAILDDIKSMMSEKLKPTIIKTVVGEADILQIFPYKVKKGVTRPFAGCKINRGTITKGDKARILRAGEVVYDGTLETLKFIKKDVKVMTQGSECGMGFLDFEDFREGDIVQCYTEVKKKRVFH